MRAWTAMTVATMVAFSLLAAGPAASADDGGRLLYGTDQLKGPTIACFERRYEPEHLAAHPKQNVARMTLVAYRGVPTVAKDGVNIEVAFRKRGAPRQFSGECRPGQTGLACALECDAGSFTLANGPDGTLALSVERGLASCDAEPAGAQGFGADDRVFRLDRVAMAACGPLIPDDIRAALIRDLAKGSK